MLWILPTDGGNLVANKGKPCIRNESRSKFWLVYEKSWANIISRLNISRLPLLPVEALSKRSGLRSSDPRKGRRSSNLYFKVGIQQTKVPSRAITRCVPLGA